MAEPTHVTFIHGLANKPSPVHLRRIWLDALAAPVEGDEGLNLANVGVSASFVYWADLFYDAPIDPAEYESAGNEVAAIVGAYDPVLAEDAWMARFREVYPDTFEDGEARAGDPSYEWIPLPAPLKRRLMRSYAREAHAYLFNVDGVRDEIRRRVLADMAAVPAGTRHVLVGHSQGSFIAYDVLTGTDCPEVAGFLTLGSPLGVDEIQQQLSWSRHDGFPAKVSGDWVNVYDALDPVSRPDPALRNDFLSGGVGRVIDVKEQSWGRWRHSATKYFRGPKLRGHLRALCGREEE